MKKFLEVSDVQFKDKNVPPIIAFFENGTLKYKPNSKPECGIYRDNEAPEKYIAAVCTNDNLLFLGNEPEEEPFRTLLAVQNKGSNKVKLIEVDKVVLKPKLLVTNPELTAASTPSSYSDLYKQFGSKQVKRKAEQRERMSFNIKSFETRLNETVTHINLDDSINAVDNIRYYGTYVKCNTGATDVNNVYNLADIISEQELEELHDEALAVLENTPEENAENYSEFFNENFKELPEDNKVFRAQVLMYAECIVQFLSLKKSALRKMNPGLCPLSDVISTKLLETFTEFTDQGRTMALSMKDKSLCHAVVAGLIACDFRLCVAPITKMGLMANDRLLKLCRSLGARPLTKEQQTTIFLKAPLPLPPKRAFKRK